MNGRRGRRAGLLATATAGLALLSACAGADRPAAVDALPGGRVHGDADRVSVLGGRLDALPLAVLHCARYGRSAQFTRSEGDRSVFACVEKGQ